MLMKSIPVIAVAIAALACASSSLLRYPKTREGPEVDDHHGTKVADPYRWLEDADSAATADWVRR